MGRETVSRILWNARQQIAALGLPGMTGAVLLVFALAFYFYAVAGQRAELDRLQRDARDRHARGQMFSRYPQKLQRSDDAQLIDFYKFFPKTATLPEWLSRIYEAADSKGLKLDLGNYKLVRENGWRLARYQITFPVKGSYVQIRGLITQILNTVPAAALDEIGLKRESIGSPVLDAQIRLTLFMEAGSP